MDEQLYSVSEAYRRMIDGARRGGRSRSAAKLKASRRNIAKSAGRPRHDGLASGWEARGLARREALEEEDARRGARDAALWVEWTSSDNVLWPHDMELGRTPDQDARAVAWLGGNLDRAAANEFAGWCDDGKPAGGLCRAVYLALGRYRNREVRGVAEPAEPADMAGDFEI